MITAMIEVNFNDTNEKSFLIIKHDANPSNVVNPMKNLLRN